MRIDAERFGSAFDRANLKINSLENLTTISRISDRVTQGLNPTFVESGLPCLNGKNVYWGKITPNDCNFVTVEEFERLSSYCLKPNDIVITLKHASKIGRAWIVTDNERKIFGRNIGLIRLKKNSAVLPTTLLFYLWAKPVQSVIDSMATGGSSGQITLPVNVLKQLKVPIFSKDFQVLLKSVFDRANNASEQSKTAYDTASNNLLHVLGLTNFAPEPQTVSIKSFRDSFGSSGRLDAEYYQSKYDSLFVALRNLKYDTLGNLVTITKSIEPGSEFYGENGVPFVRVSDINKYGIQPPEIHIPANLTDLRLQKDTILLSKDGSVGIAYKVEQDMDCITSGALLHLRIKSEKSVLPDYLTLVLNSLIVRLQAERDAGGSIIQHWKPSEIEQVVIPLLDAPNQEEIASKVQRSFELRRQSDHLLDNAKRAVEIAIEIGEQAAIEWLDEISDCANNATKSV